jgi:hypothetical protein
MRCYLSVLCVLVVALLCGARDGGALPLSVAYVDSVTGTEWAQVAEATGYHHSQYETVCATDGATACTANLPGVELAGWTWATTRQVMELMMDVTGLQGMVRELYDPAYGQTFFIGSTVEAADSTWAPRFLAAFTPTVTTDTYRAVIGWAADGTYIDRNTAYLPEVIDAVQGIDIASRGNLSDTHDDWVSGRLVNPGSPERGAWLFRPAQSVPEPSSLLLLGLGGVFGALSRQRTRRRAS